jgi:penicillin-binding protein 2
MLNIPLKDHFRETRIFGSRLTVVAGAIALIVFLLLLRMLWLQVVHYKHYETRARANQVTPLPVPAVRGLILDRNGVVLAQNYPVYTLELVPEQINDMGETLQRLGELVTLTPADLRQFEKQRRGRPRFESMTLRTNLTDEEAARIAVNRPHLQGVELHARLQRYYPLGSLGVHLLGYVGRISEQEQDRIDRIAYRGIYHIGKLGIENFYERALLGRVGVEHVETNARGRSLRVIDREAPRAGDNLHLHIDARLQAAAEKALKGKRGALVALDPHTGAILAFASMPSYDPNPFVNGIDSASYQKLLQDPDKPLINRALNGQYSPGSTIKPFMGLAALQSGQIDANDTVQCRGAYSLPGDSHRYRDWKKLGHGTMNLHDAIVQSCDVYFYKTAVTLGIDYLHPFLTRFGFGKPTGIDLPNESAGLVPSRAWREARGEKWYLGETVVTGIGQGPILVTPLQLATATAALANGRRLVRPQILQAMQRPDSVVRRDNRPEYSAELATDHPEQLAAVVAGMKDVVHGERGTARGIGWNAPYTIAGKTGTAQVASVAQDEVYDESRVPLRLRDHALFISFAPVEAPRIAVAVVVENGGHGSSAAAPLARQIMDYYLLPDKMPPLSAAEAAQR